MTATIRGGRFLVSCPVGPKGQACSSERYLRVDSHPTCSLRDRRPRYRCLQQWDARSHSDAGYDYERQKAQYEFDLTALVVPEADSVVEAGRLVQALPELWAGADLSERRRLLLTVLDAVYVDVRSPGAPISSRPKAAFEAVLAGTPALASPIQS